MKQYVVDAFAERLFEGNPAAVCVLEQFPDDCLMQNIAKENALSETAFAVKHGDHYHLRWFTPGGEIDLCGHATLATGFVILNFYERESEEVHFDTLSGELIVKRREDLYEMEFPVYDLRPVEVTDAMEAAMGKRPREAWMGRDLVCVFEDARDISGMVVDQEKVSELDGLLLHVTASPENSSFDCISRSFAPKCAIPEDPVCGSGHCHIVPFWAKVLGKDNLVARQASSRGGTLYCQMDGNRIHISGKAVLYSVAEVMV